MNIIKIQSDLLKAKITDILYRVIYYKDEDCLCYSPDGSVLYKIPEKLFLLDENKIFGNILPIDIKRSYPQLFADIDNETPVPKTDTMKTLTDENGTRTVVKIKDETKTAWVNVKLLKNFDNDCHFVITGKYTPLYVIEDGVKVGLVLPYKMKDEDYD